MKKLLALVLSCIFVLLLASCGEELPASDYVKKGKIMVDNTIPFVIDDSVAIDAKEAESSLRVGMRYITFAAKFGYKIFHSEDTPILSSSSSFTYYTVYPLNDGRLLYLHIEPDNKGEYIIDEYSVIADKNTYVNNILAFDAPYVLMNVSAENREKDFLNGIEKSSLVYSTFMKLEEALGLSSVEYIPSSFANGSDWNMAVRMIYLENETADVFELKMRSDTTSHTLTKITYSYSNGEFVKKETEEKTIELEKVVPLLEKLKTSNVDNSVYSEIKDLATLDKGIFFFADGGITYEEEQYYSRCNFIYSYTMTDTDVADYWTALNNLFGE